MTPAAQSVYDRRQEIFDDARDAVEKAALDGGMIALHSAARDLLDRHPDSAMTIEEIEAEIARLAAAHDVAVVFE